MIYYFGGIKVEALMFGVAFYWSLVFVKLIQTSQHSDERCYPWFQFFFKVIKYLLANMSFRLSCICFKNHRLER